MLAGEFEQSLGPQEFLYNQCHQDVTWSADALQCDVCDIWLHKDCLGLSEDEYNRLDQTATCWLCNE